MDSRLLSGTVEMLMLEVISRGPSYGYENRTESQFTLRRVF